MEQTIQKPGYHITNIQKGVLGESSKIREEVEELIDAEKQECKVMAIVELADLIGAIEVYLEKNMKGLTVNDLQKMASITRRAFTNGHRK